MIRPDAVHLYAYPNGSRSDITPYCWMLRPLGDADKQSD